MIKLQDGTRITRQEYDKRIYKAKKLKIEIFLHENGYLYCEECYKNECKPIDCSHDISVSKCIKIGKPELAYDVNNLTLRGRPCHQLFDGLDIKQNKI